MGARAELVGSAVTFGRFSHLLGVLARFKPARRLVERLRSLNLPLSAWRLANSFLISNVGNR